MNSTQIFSNEYKITVQALKSKTVDELEMLAKSIQATISQQIKQRDEFVEKTQKSLLSMENKFPELKNFGSFSSVTLVKKMLETMGSGLYEKQAQELNNLMAILTPNYKPPVQTEDQKQFSQTIKQLGVQYISLNEKITNSEDLLKIINGAIAEKKLDQSASGQSNVTQLLKTLIQATEKNTTISESQTTNAETNVKKNIETSSFGGISFHNKK